MSRGGLCVVRRDLWLTPKLWSVCKTGHIDIGKHTHDVRGTTHAQPTNHMASDITCHSITMCTLCKHLLMPSLSLCLSAEFHTPIQISPTTIVHMPDTSVILLLYRTQTAISKFKTLAIRTRRRCELCSVVACIESHCYFID
jgi:hypothetical protein